MSEPERESPPGEPPAGDDVPSPGDEGREFDYAACVRLLERIAADHARMAEVPEEWRMRLRVAAGRVSRPSHRERKAFSRKVRDDRKSRRRAHDEAILDRTGMRRQRQALVYPTPAPELPGSEHAGSEPAGSRDAGPESPGATAWDPTDPPRLLDERNCYICKADYREVHPFYDSLCPACAALNWEKRAQTADLTGRVALLTGGRVKIGYQTGIKLLRAGAKLIVTTRFSRDAADRYRREPDFEEWCDRLEIYGLDLRHTPSVEAFTAHLLEREDRLDFLVNNACQTVRRPPGFYDHLMELESRPHGELPAEVRPVLLAYEELLHDTESRDAGGRNRTDRGDGDPRELVAGAGSRSERAGLELSAALSQLVLVSGDEHRGEDLFPTGRLDADLQQVDLRDRNSWRLPLAEVPTVELLEVHLTNAVAPFVLNARLKPLMVRPGTRDQHVVNVSAVEGQFYRSFKTDKHPHTNMAKAALNMMTRTSAPDYFRDGIHMNSVDTGWITDEDPHAIQRRKTEEHGFHPPLDHVDAAARILDPIFDGLNRGEHFWGQFLKDYRPTRW